MQNPVTFSKQQYLDAALVLSRAFVLIIDHWTNQGYKIKQADGSKKMCIFGAVDEAARQLFNTRSLDSDATTFLLQSNSMQYFDMSAVSANDILGLNAVTKLFSLSIEDAITNAVDPSANYRRLEYRRA